jgi:hypothetical protein
MAASGGPILMVQIENEFGTWNAGGQTTYLEVSAHGESIELLLSIV